VPILSSMILRDILLAKGVTGPSDLGRRLDISKQHAWLLWHGKNLPSLAMAQRISAHFDIPFDQLAGLERKEPMKRRGPRPKSSNGTKGKGRRPGRKGKGGQT
jgi:transcriptional regulator with XRE-family HTH domain